LRARRKAQTQGLVERSELLNYLLEHSGACHVLEVDESIRAAERSRVDSPVTFETKDQRNTKFGGPVPDRLLIGAQDICKSLEADPGERLLPDHLLLV
jgi:hypothetical protein